MNILYLTISKINLNDTAIYPDLVNALIKHKHKVTIVYAGVKDENEEALVSKDGVTFLNVDVSEMFSKNYIKKGIATISCGSKIKKAINKYLKDESFDLCLYATPPVTFSSTVEYVKKHFSCKSYLMLKDIFPQNGADIGLYSKFGPVFSYFKMKEKTLYKVSDRIGCMSEGNKKYLLEHNKTLDASKVEVFPNTLDTSVYANNILAKDLGTSEKVKFIFGGNMGRPQGIDFLISAITSEECRKIKKAEFIFIGAGNEVDKIKKAAGENDNIKYYDRVSPAEYNKMLSDSQVGIISLDYRFTIPNYPSRTLTYMALKKPILACTDVNTDLKDLVVSQAKCGLWCESNDIKNFVYNVKLLVEDIVLRNEYGKNGYNYLIDNFDVERSVSLLENFIENK